MRLSIPTNWDTGLLDGLYGLSVNTMFGKLPQDIVGGGRPSSILPHVDRDYVKEYIRRVQLLGINFNYLMNASCLGMLESDSEFLKKVEEEVEWICEVKPHSVTVVLPSLLLLLKKKAPDIKVVISIFSHVNSIQRAKHYEALGADEIVIIQKFNRSFDFLRRLRDSVRCDLQLLANTGCLFGCPFRKYHQNINAHASQVRDELGCFYIDYPFMNCSRIKLENPEELIKARWIRPEDLSYYEKNIGIDKFKLMERTKPTSWILNVVRAYAHGRFEGNLADILSLTNKRDRDIKSQAGKYFKRPDLVNLGAMGKLSKGFAGVEFYIDNGALDGFLRFFERKECTGISCDSCRYCHKVARDVIRPLTSRAEKALKFLRESNSDLVSGCFFC